MGFCGSAVRIAPAWHSRFEARMREGIMQGAFGGLPKGLCVITRVCARGATVRARTGFATPHSGARPSRGGSPPRRLPPCTRALRRGRVKQVQDGFRHIGERVVRGGGSGWCVFLTRFVSSILGPSGTPVPTGGWFMDGGNPFRDQPKTIATAGVIQAAEPQHFNRAPQGANELRS